MDGCRFDMEARCMVHQGSGAAPIICTHAADVLRAKVEEAEHLEAELTDAGKQLGVEVAGLRGRLASLEAANARLREALVWLQDHHCSGVCDEVGHARVMHAVNTALSPDAARATLAERADLIERLEASQDEVHRARIELTRLRAVVGAVGRFLEDGVSESREAWIPGWLSNEYAALVDAWLALPSEMRDAPAAWCEGRGEEEAP